LGKGVAEGPRNGSATGRSIGARVMDLVHQRNDQSMNRRVVGSPRTSESSEAVENGRGMRGGAGAEGARPGAADSASGCGLLDPDAEAEDEERAEIDLLKPEGLTFAELPGMSELLRRSPSDGDDSGLVRLGFWSCQAHGLDDGVRCPPSPAPPLDEPSAAYVPSNPNPPDLPLQSSRESSSSFLALQPVRK
jgi:hypothetical protein